MSHAVYWAGIPCALDSRAPTRYTRARGLEPATATVGIPRRLLSSLVPQPPSDPFKVEEATSPGLLSFLNASTPTTEGAPVPMPFVGDLIITEDDGDGTPRVTLHQRQMYFVEALVVDPEHQDRTNSGADPLLAVQLAGIQRFWDAHGEITRNWNVLRGPAEQLAAADPRRTQDVAVQDALAAKVYTAGTSKEGGRDPIPLREIMQACLDALPGGLQIERWPDAPPPPDNARAWGASPKAIVSDLCEYHGLCVDVGPDLGVRFYLRGEGAIGESGESPGDDNDQPHDPETGGGAWADAVTSNGDRYARRPTHRPDQVLVVGDRTVMDAAVDWCRPVLYYQEVPPEGGKPLSPVVLEVTPENLATLASGRTPTEAASGDKLAEFLLGLSTVDAVGFVSPFPPAGATPPAELAPLTWQRLVLVGSDETWEQAIPGMPEQVRTLLREQLGRVYQVDPRLLRLCPIRDRATRDYQGRRLAPTVEAFGFRALRGKGKRPPRGPSDVGDAEASLPGAKDEARKDLVAELERIRREIEEDRKRIKMLTGPSAEELGVALRDHYQRVRKEEGQAAAFLAAFPDGLGLAVESVAQWLGADPGVGYALYGAGSPVGGAPQEEGDAFASARDAEARVFNAWARKLKLDGVLGLVPESMDKEAAEAEVRKIEERIKLGEAEYRDLERELNPKLSKQNELAAVETELTRIRAQEKGREPRALRLKAKRLREELDAMEEAEAEAKAKEEEEVEIVYHVNLGRRAVPYTILDRARGVIRVDGPTPPVWLANTSAADPADTFAHFMPVRITFGTTNGSDVDLVTGGSLNGSENYFLASIAEALSNAPELAPLVGTLGHLIPSEAGERRTAFGFTRANLSGDAVVDQQRVRRITVGTFREYVELGGRSNREELRARALVLARALLEQPADLPDGSLVLRGPRVVLCNGVVSATEVRWAGAGGFVTEVSLHVDTEPLPGVEGVARDPGPARFVWGLDVEGSRDA